MPDMFGGDNMSASYGHPSSKPKLAKIITDSFEWGESKPIQRLCKIRTSEEHVCPTCRGDKYESTGFVGHSNKCSTCKGVGKVRKISWNWQATMEDGSVVNLEPLPKNSTSTINQDLSAIQKEVGVVL